MLPSPQSTTGWLLLEQGDLAGGVIVSKPPFRPVCLEMDLEKCEIANFGKLKSDPASITVAKAIANEISKADWNKLWGFISVLNGT